MDANRPKTPPILSPLPDEMGKDGFTPDQLAAQRDDAFRSADQAMALVISHEGRIEKLTAENEKLKNACETHLELADDYRSRWLCAENRFESAELARIHHRDTLQELVSQLQSGGMCYEFDHIVTIRILKKREPWLSWVLEEDSKENSDV